MTAPRCRVPGCAAEAEEFFCQRHYFVLPPVQAQFLFRWQFKMQRCRDDDTKQHMREQLHGYVQEAIRTIEQSVATSQAAPDSARRQTTPPCVAAGAANQGRFL
jgi:hypothetical protein